MNWMGERGTALVSDHVIFLHYDLTLTLRWLGENVFFHCFCCCCLLYNLHVELETISCPSWLVASVYSPALPPSRFNDLLSGATIYQMAQRGMAAITIFNVQQLCKNRSPTWPDPTASGRAALTEIMQMFISCSLCCIKCLKLASLFVLGGFEMIMETPGRSRET